MTILNNCCRLDLWSAWLDLSIWNC